MKDNDSTDAEISQDSYQILYGNIESADISNIRGDSAQVHHR